MDLLHRTEVKLNSRASPGSVLDLPMFADGGVRDDLESSEIAGPQMRPIQPRPLLGLSLVLVLNDAHPVPGA